MSNTEKRSPEDEGTTAAGSERGTADDPVPGTGDPAAVGTKGGGEWPSKDAPPSPEAPGSDPARASALAAARRERTQPGGLGESPYEADPDQAAVGSTAGEASDDDAPARDAGAARQRGPAPPGAPTTDQT